MMEMLIKCHLWRMVTGEGEGSAYERQWMATLVEEDLRQMKIP